MIGKLLPCPQKYGKLWGERNGAVMITTEIISECSQIDKNAVFFSTSGQISILEK